MADFYCDHGAYTSVLGTVPTWGAPQEGDGSTKDAATASSTGSVLFGSVPTSGVISVFGAVVTLSGVLGAASVDAAADALATSINNTTNPVTSGFAVGVPRLQNLVYARGPAGGAPAGTCQIMTRVGSATLNVTGIVSTFNGSPALTQFSGGSGGCWGWLLNDVTVGVSSFHAAGNYGVLGEVNPYISVNGVGTKTLPTEYDTTWVRSGDGRTVTLPVNVSVLHTTAYHNNVVIDSNTKWTWDSGTGVVTISMACSGADIMFRFANAATVSKSLGALVPEKLRIYFRSAGGGGGQLVFRSGNGGGNPIGKLWNVLVEENPANPATQGIKLSITGEYQNFALERVRFSLLVPRSTGWPQSGFGDIGLTGMFSMIGCRVETNFTGLTDPGPVFGNPYFGSQTGFRVEGSVFSGWPSGVLRLFGTVTNPASANVIVRNNSGLRIDAGTYIGVADGLAYAKDEFQGRFVFSSIDTGLTFREETRRGACDWVYGANYPTLRALQPDGTPWCVKLEWLSTAALVYDATPLRTIPLTQLFRGTAGAKTITTELLLPNSATFDSLNIVMTVSYVDNATGLVAYETTQGVMAPAASGLAWNLAGLSGYSAKKLYLTTTKAIKPNTAVSVFVELRRRAVGNVQVYVDPEFSIA